MPEVISDAPVIIKLSKKQLKRSAGQIVGTKKPWSVLLLSITFVLLIVSVVTAIFSLFAIQSMSGELVKGQMAAQLLALKVMSTAEIRASMDTPAFRELIDAASQLSAGYVVPEFHTLYWLVHFTAMLPLLVIIAAVIVRRSGTPLEEHTLHVTFDADGIVVQRGATRMVHLWTAVKSVKLSPNQGRIDGLLLITLEYGYHHVWPEKSFASRDEFLLTGHRISALFLAPRTASE